MTESRSSCRIGTGVVDAELAHPTAPVTATSVAKPLPPKRLREGRGLKDFTTVCQIGNRYQIGTHSAYYFQRVVFAGVKGTPIDNFLGTETALKNNTPDSEAETQKMLLGNTLRGFCEKQGTKRFQRLLRTRPRLLLPARGRRERACESQRSGGYSFQL